MTALLEYLRDFNLVSIAVRLFLAALIGGMIGLERGRKRRPAGFRTYMLVCMGSAACMILSQYLTEMISTHWAQIVSGLDFSVSTDASRFGAQCINGIGFLGAGTIVITGTSQVKGLTTAAGLWASACLGLAAGVGFYEAVFPAAILILLTITVFTHIEAGLVSMSKNMDVLVEFDHLDDLGTVIRALKDEKAKIYDVEVNKRSISTGHPSAVFSVVLGSRRRHSEIVSMLADLECVESVEEI